MQTDDRPDDPFYVPLPDDDRTDDPFYVPLPDGSLFDYDITVTLPHDNLYSPCFIDCFDNAVPGDIDYSGIWCGTAEDGDESVQKLSRKIQKKIPEKNPRKKKIKKSDTKMKHPQIITYKNVR